jgi:hypothetical protein
MSALSLAVGLLSRSIVVVSSRRCNVMPTTDNIVGTMSASRCRHDYHNISIAASFCLCYRRRSSPPISTTSARWQSILAFAANSPRRSSNSARSTATTRSISARSASVSNTLARRHKVAIRLILDACCLRCERQRHRHRRHRHCRISVDAFSFVCLFFNLRFSILCFFFFFFFCFLVDTDATAGVGPRGLLNNISDSGVSELDGSYLRSLDAARHGAYCTARAAVGNENEANAAQQEQCRQRARCRRRQQRQICNIANAIFESAAVYSQFAPVVLLGEIFFLYVYYDSFDCAFGFDSCSVLFLFSFIYIYRHGRRVAQVVQRQRQQNACVGVAERVPFGTSRFHCDSRRRIQLEQETGRHAKSTMSIVTSLRRRSRYRASFWRMLSSRHDQSSTASSTARHRNRLLLFVF